MDIYHDLITIFPKERETAKMFILNVYSPPRNRDHKFNLLFALTRREVGPHALIVVGDFNAPHTAWGYRCGNKKGTDLWKQIQLHHFSVLTEPGIATRIGNSVQVDTAPDLTFALHMRYEEWNVTGHTLGSDHFVIETVIKHTAKMKYTPRQATLVEWDEFRFLRSSNADDVPISDIDAWTEQLLKDIKTTTRTLDQDIPSLTIDSRLAHLWEAYQSIQKR